MMNTDQRKGQLFNLESLLCPCILLGNIQSKLHREDPLCTCSCRPECELGPHGFQSCMYTCCLTSCGWPLSPCLSWHLLRMRRKFQTLYEYDDRLKPHTSNCAYLKLFCCWWINLEEQFNFVNHLWEENMLTFHWDYDRFHDLTGPRPTFPSQTVLIFAPQNFQTTTFMNKFLRHTSISANVAATSASSKNLQHFLSPEMIDLEHVEQIETGVKTHMGKNGQISFVEVWKIPPTKFHSQTLAKSIPSAVASYYIFDLTETESIDKVKKAYLEHGFFSTGRRLAVVLNDVNADAPDNAALSTKQKKSVVFSFQDDSAESNSAPNSNSSSPREKENINLSEAPEISPLITPTLRIPKKGLKELQNWAKSHSSILYEVSLNKQDDMSELYKVFSEAFEPSL